MRLIRFIFYILNHAHMFGIRINTYYNIDIN